MCNFDAGGKRGAGTIKSGIGSLWGISIMGSNTIVAQEQLFMPRFRNRGARVKNIILFFCFEKLFFFFSMMITCGGAQLGGQEDRALGDENFVFVFAFSAWSVGRDRFDVTEKETGIW